MKGDRPDVYWEAARAYVDSSAPEPVRIVGYDRVGSVNSLSHDARFQAAVDAVLEWVRKDEMGS